MTPYQRAEMVVECRKRDIEVNPTVERIYWNLLVWHSHLKYSNVEFAEALRSLINEHGWPLVNHGGTIVNPAKREAGMMAQRIHELQKG